jgi:hypothetical protein
MEIPQRSSLVPCKGVVSFRSEVRQMEEAAKETVIVVHGTFAAPQAGASRWYQPIEGVSATTGFIAKLDAALEERGSPARCWAHCSQGNQGFHWSGENSWIDRTRAASELGNYVLNLRKEGWLCHIVAHSHGGNVVLEALPQITSAPSSGASLGKIVTLGTPFMDTMTSILESIRRNRSFQIELSRIAAISFIIWFILSVVIVALYDAIVRFAQWISFAQWIPDRDTFSNIVMLSIFIVTFLISAIAFRFLQKSQNVQTIFNGGTQIQPKFLAIGSVMDEPWQLLHHMRNTLNPMAVEGNLIRYLISSTQTHISRGRQIGRMYQVKSYGDLKLMAKLVLGLTHLLFLLPAVLLMIAAIGVLFLLGPTEIFLFVGLCAIYCGICFVWILLFTRMFGPEFYSAFFAPLRWCAYRVDAIKDIFREIATYIVRSRGWSVVLAIAMGLEGYRHQLPRIEQHPSILPGVTYKNMPAGAQQRALAKRGAWIDRHLDNIAQTFSKLVVTSADIALLQHAIEADQTLVHAAYYTDDECIAQIADWIAAKDDPPSNAITAAEARGDA